MHIASLRRLSASIFCSGILLAAAGACANDRTRLMEGIMATGQLSCVSEAETLWKKTVVDDLALMMTQSARRALKLNAQWAPGNPDFERVRALIAAQAAADLAGARPFFRHAALADGVRASLRAMSMDDLRFAAAFFARPAGRVFWEEDIDYLGCLRYAGVQEAVAGPGALDTLEPRRAALRAKFAASGAKRSLTEREDYVAGKTRLAPLIKLTGFPELDKDASHVHGERIKALRPAIEKISAPYRQNTGKSRKP